MKRNPLTITIGALLVVIFGLWLFVFQVRKSEVVLVTTFGNPTLTRSTPGPYFKWPWPIQRIYRFDQRIQNFAEDKVDESQTVDHYILLVKVYVGWQIENPQVFFPRFASGAVSESDRGPINLAENTLGGILRNAKSAVVGRHPLSDFISTDPATLKFPAIENEILAAVQDQVKSNGYGISVQFLGVKKLGFPESVTQEIFKQMTSERIRQSSLIQSQGESEASRIRSTANSQAAQMLRTADADATAIRGQGQANAAKSFAEFEKNPDLASFLLNLHALGLSLNNRSTLIFDNRTQPYSLFEGFSPTNAPNRKQP